MYQLPKSRDLGINTCAACFDKQREIDRLREEVTRLKGLLRYRERQEHALPFASSTPSSKIPVKANTAVEETKRRGGGQVGHTGHGRSKVEVAQAARVVSVPIGDECPQCGEALRDKGWRERTVLDMQPVVVEPVVYRLQRKYCEGCRQAVQANAPAVLPKTLFGNQLIAEVLTNHYVHGEPMGRISERLGLGLGSLLEMAHRTAGLFRGIVEELCREYRQAMVRHADETGWRTDGQSGYAWLFCTENLSIFLFRRSRSSAVAKEILGVEPLLGVLVVDRYNAYNRAPCALQYCYAHLLRDVEDLEKEFATDTQVSAFTSTLCPLLAEAMHLRRQAITDAQYYERAQQIKQKIIAVTQSQARHPGISKLQDIFREKSERLYQWVESRLVPAENNRAERELRPTVIARKVSFGSQSEEGAKTREVLMTLLCTLRKRVKRPQDKLKEVLDQIARDPQADALKLLWVADTS